MQDLVQDDPHKDKVQWVWLVPIILYMMTQTGLGVWWASSTDARLNHVIITSTDEVNEVVEEQLRLRQQLYNVQNNYTLLSREISQNTTAIAGVNSDIHDLSSRVSETNQLIRQLITRNQDVSAPSQSGVVPGNQTR